MNGLDLFSGIGGNSLALREWVKVLAYCESDRHAQSVLLSRMSDGFINESPIWDDITTLTGRHFDVPIDIITAGFPCQDISVAGRGEGLEGKRSGLFFEIVRLAKEFQPSFVFLENVPAIRTRGLETVVREFSDLGYDCRWCTVSAAQVGAPHKRERWFLLAANRNRIDLWDMYWRECRENGEGENELEHNGEQRELARSTDANWWASEPDVVRVANGVPLRVERLKRLGNAVVPMQAKVAFEYLLMSKIPPKIDIDSESVDGID